MFVYNKYLSPCHRFICALHLPPPIYLHLSLSSALKSFTLRFSLSRYLMAFAVQGHHFP